MSDSTDDTVAPSTPPGAPEAGTAPAPAEGSTQASAEPVVPQNREGFISRNFFWLLAGILLIEIVIYGWRGDIQVCVAKEGVHDFKLIGAETTEQNRWQIPRCEERTNLSMFSHYEEQVTNAKQVACGKAASFKLRGEKDACVRSSDGWKWRAETSNVMPWDLRIYKTMFHLD